MVTALTGYCGVACRQGPRRVPCRVPAGLVFGGSLPHNGASTRKWRNGRRAVFRWQCPYGRGGSNPPLRTERERPRHAFRRGLSRSSGMWIWEPPQRSEDGGVPPCAREDEGPRTSRFGALRAFVGGPSSCLGEQSPVSHHLKILIEDCLLTQGRRANWDWSARDEPRPAVGAALWPALGGGSPLPPRESPSAGRTSNAGEMMMVCQPTRLRWSGRSRLATATGSP